MNSINDIDSNKNLERFVSVMICLIVFFMSLRVPLDTDFWWHINAGRATISQQSPLLHDIFSYTRSDVPWINHSWLSEVFYYLIYKLFGSAGIMILVAVVATATTMIVFKLLKGSVLVRAFLTVFSVLLMAVIWSPRPQLFSLFFLALLVWFEQKLDKQRNNIYLIVIPVLFMVWANFHAGFILGVAYLGLVLFGKTIDYYLNPNKTDIKNKSIITSLKLLLFSGILTLINPNGINVWVVQFKTIGVSSLQDFISEWASPNFHELFQQPFLWVWLIFVFFISTGILSLPFEKIFPLIFFGGLGFISRRNIAPFAIIIIPLLSEVIVAFYDKTVKDALSRKFIRNITLKNTKPKPLLQKIINLTMIFIIAIITAIKIVYLSNPFVLQDYEEKNFPFQAVRNIDPDEYMNRNLLNSYAWGGYISWYQPAIKVYVDGRTDLFGDDIILDWITMVNADSGWENLFNNYQIEWVILENDRPIIKELRINQWELVYQDNLSIIMKKPIEKE